MSQTVAALPVGPSTPIESAASSRSGLSELRLTVAVAPRPTESYSSPPLTATSPESPTIGLAVNPFFGMENDWEKYLTARGPGATHWLFSEDRGLLGAGRPHSRRSTTT